MPDLPTFPAPQCLSPPHHTQVIFQKHIYHPVAPLLKTSVWSGFWCHLSECGQSLKSPTALQRLLKGSWSLTLHHIFSLLWLLSPSLPENCFSFSDTQMAHLLFWETYVLQKRFGNLFWGSPSTRGICSWCCNYLCSCLNAHTRPEASTHKNCDSLYLCVLLTIRYLSRAGSQCV